jgi:hypothetical protein
MLYIYLYIYICIHTANFTKLRVILGHNMLAAALNVSGQITVPKGYNTSTDNCVVSGSSTTKTTFNMFPIYGYHKIGPKCPLADAPEHTTDAPEHTADTPRAASAIAKSNLENITTQGYAHRWVMVSQSCKQFIL